MNSSHRLKRDVLNFLSKQEFKQCEFKDIRNSFVQDYPEFSAKMYYAKIYQIIRWLESENLFVIDKKGGTYKYSTVENKNIYLSKGKRVNEDDALKKQLLIDFHKVNIKVHRINAEIETFDKYINLYPKIKENIAEFIKDRKKSLLELQSELSAIEIIMESI